MKLSQTLCLALLALCLGTHAREIKSRIVGGSITTEKKHPFIVSLRQNTIHRCGGSLISKDWVLTASHCMAPNIINKVVGGAEKSYDPGQVSSNIAQTIMHENYDTKLHSNDIALLKLATPFPESERVAYIKMEASFIDTERACATIGWGAEAMGDPMGSQDLKILDEKTITQAVCRDDYFWQRYRKLGRDLTDNELCTKPNKAMEGVCQGDSGGPTFIAKGSQFTLIGVVSVGVGCAIGAADIHSRVSAYREWIRQKSEV